MTGSSSIFMFVCHRLMARRWRFMLYIQDMERPLVARKNFIHLESLLYIAQSYIHPIRTAELINVYRQAEMETHVVYSHRDSTGHSLRPNVNRFTNGSQAWHHLLPSSLKRSLRLSPCTFALADDSSDRILVIRTYALWGKNKYILYLLCVGLTAACAILFFSVTQFKAVPTRDPTDPESRGVCIAGGGPGGHDWSMVCFNFSLSRGLCVE